MKFPLSKIDVKEYHDKVFTLIKDDKCKIYIDTNIIALFYGIHDSARKEFFDWLKDLITKKRVKVPVWVINEYTNRFIRNQIQDYLSPLKKVATLKTEFEQVCTFLKMHIEDSNLNQSKYSSVAEFQGDINDMLDKFEKIAFTAKNKDDKYKLKIHDEINQVLGNCILNSDIDKILSNIDSLGLIRYNHKLPPGFKDEKKDLNTHGDLILWYEILQNCKKENVKKAILLTDDEKKDWVYAPNKLIINSKEISNTKPQFKIADPRLVHEFKLISGSEDFYIISFELLTQVLIENISNSFTNLASALQLVHRQSSEVIIAEDISNIENHELVILEQENNSTKLISEVTEAPTEKEPGLITETSSPIENAKDSFKYSSYALADRDFPLVDNTYFTTVIEQLKSYNWYIQNPCIDELLTFNSKSLKETQSNADSLFVIGRNIYQSACGGSGSAVDFIKRIRFKLSKFTDYFVNHLYSGILYEIYFDSTNNFRGDKLKSYYINEVFEILDLPRIKPSIYFIEMALKEYENNLLYLPYKAEDVKISIVFDKELKTTDDWLLGKVNYLTVIEIKGNGFSLLTENEKEALDIYYPSLNYSGLIDLICKTYGIPSKHYSVEIEPDIDKSLQILLGNKKLATTRDHKTLGV